MQASIQSRHPRIAAEIDGAIDTLRKLREITGTSAFDLGAVPPPGQVGPPGLEATQAMTAAFTIRPATLSLAGTEAEPEGERVMPDLSAGSSFARYQIVRSLGRGAMGAVYLAYDTQLHRHVALKTPFLGNSRLTIERFYREARTAAQLRSPHLCPIYDVGAVGGVHYLSMAYIDGEPLSRALSAGKLKAPAEIAEVIRKIARGLQKAHEQGIIHRDLKPDNIMIDHDGEPVVMDFGLARKVDDEVQITMAGKVIGTPAYMSPEQVEGDSAKVGPATDIYSLGIVVYQMLTGRLPFQGSLASVLHQVVSVAPSLPSTINPDLCADLRLERICLRMVAKSPADRFASMADVAAALESPSSDLGKPSERPSAWSKVWSLPSRLRPRRACGANPPAQVAKRPADESQSDFSLAPNPGTPSAPPASAPGKSAPSAEQPTQEATLANG